MNELFLQAYPLERPAVAYSYETHRKSFPLHVPFRGALLRTLMKKFRHLHRWRFGLPTSDEQAAKQFDGAWSSDPRESKVVCSFPDLAPVDPHPGPSKPVIALHRLLSPRASAVEPLIFLKPMISASTQGTTK